MRTFSITILLSGALAMAALSPIAANAGTIGIHYLEAGAGYTHLRKNSDDKIDMETFCATANYSVFGDDAPLVYLDIRAKYEYSRGDKNAMGERSDYHLGSLEALVGISILDFITPHAFGGVTYGDFNIPAPADKNADGDFGGTVGAGIQFEFIPTVFKMTPYVRYTKFENLQEMCYGIDTTFWFTWFGIGADVNYRRYSELDLDSFQATAYIGIRF